MIMSATKNNAVNGATRLFGIIGDPIAQVKSPTVYNDMFGALQKNAVMIPLHTRPEKFDECMRGLKALANLDGILVTIPYKARVIPHVDSLLPTAARIGAVNALRRNEDGTWAGEIFDGKGFVEGLRASGGHPERLSVMLLGAGGAGSAIADAIAEAGATSITIHDPDQKKAQALAALIARTNTHCSARAGAPTVEGIDVLVNASPTGMYPDESLPADFATFSPNLFVADIVPRPDPTPLLRLARRCGCRTMDGQAMVAGQTSAILLFFGTAP